MDYSRIYADMLENEGVGFFEKSLTLGQPNNNSVVKNFIRTKLSTLADIVPTCDCSAERIAMALLLVSFPTHLYTLLLCL